MSKSIILSKDMRLIENEVLDITKEEVEGEGIKVIL